MLQNMQLAAPEVDSVLVQLLSRWAERGRDGSPRSQVPVILSLIFTKSSLIHLLTLTHSHQVVAMHIALGIQAKLQYAKLQMQSAHVCYWLHCHCIQVVFLDVQVPAC